jgi:putative inorganic carbon (hco3(-)) transporter
MQGATLESGSDLFWSATPAPTVARRKTRLGGAFVLFLLLNASLYIRPADILPALEGAPIYQFLIIVCLLLAIRAVSAQLKIRDLRTRPISFCVIGLGVIILLSQAANGLWENIGTDGVEFIKVVLYYLLLVAVVNSPKRLRIFLYVLGFFIAIIATLTLLQYHNYIDLVALRPLTDVGMEEDVKVKFPRLRGPGAFYDPNDFCHILAVGSLIAFHGMTDRRLKLKRVAYLGMFVLMLYAIVLTQSRGGMLALIAGMGVLALARFGVKKTLIVLVLAMPALFLASGRQFDISTGDSTGQQRVQIWSEAFDMVRANPLLGGGEDQFKKSAGYVAHNSFLQCYAELGFFGGTLFVGAWWLTMRDLNPLPGKGLRPWDPELADLRSTISGIMAAYIVGMLTLSRCYVVPTYTILGIATVFSTMAVEGLKEPKGTHRRLFLKMAGASLVVLILFDMFVRFAVRFS